MKAKQKIIVVETEEQQTDISKMQQTTKNEPSNQPYIQSE